MYANRFVDGPRFRPASLGAALAVNGGVTAALLLANPVWIPKLPRDPLTIIDIAPTPEPTVTPEPRRAEPRPAPSATVTAPRREVETPPRPDVLTWEPATGEPTGPAAGTGTGEGTAGREADPPAVPMFVAAREDPRYLADFQPPYPDYERDAGREDVVRLRIRIGIDGRVKQVERLAGRDSFARVAVAHALAKWRFRPATRGGVPEQSWKVMSVRFTLND